MAVSNSMLTAKEANCIVLEMLCDPYCDKDRLRTYLGQCQKTANEDFSDVINGVSQENGFSPLHVSVRRCMVDATRILLQFGGDFEAKGPDGETPLMLACTTKILPLVHILVEAGADVSVVDNNGRCCTHYAAQSGSPHILHYLHITKGVDFLAKDKMCNTLLHIAVQNKHVSTVQYLLKHERSLLRMNKEDGNSPMHEACSQGDAQTAIQLLRTMDERLLHATNANGQTPHDLLLSSSHPKKILIGKKLAFLSSLRTVRLVAWWSWIVQLILPGISLAFAPTSYIYLGFPLNYISPVVIVLCGFFRPLFSHRINNTVFNWPNPALFGAMLSGFTHTGICVIVYFFCEWMLMHWWMLTMLAVSAFMFYNFIKLLKEDPGVMKVSKCGDDGVPLTIVDVATQSLDGAFCMNCEIVTPERTKHCRLCEACCKGFDHHCMWLMKCVGYGNHRRFIVFCFLLGLDNFLFVISSCYYLVVMTEDSSIQSIWNNAVNEYSWLSFFVLCNFFTGIFAWLVIYLLSVNSKCAKDSFTPTQQISLTNFNEQIENVSSLRTKYFDSKGQIVYGKKRVFTPVSWRERYAAIKLFFLDYDSWYKCRFGNQGGQYCNV